MSFPNGSVVKNPPANAGNVGLIPGSKRAPGIRNVKPLQLSWLGNPMDRGAWRATVHGVTKSQTQLSNWAQAHTYNPLGSKGQQFRKFKGQPLGCLDVGICSSSQKRQEYRVAEAGSQALRAPREVESPHIVRDQLHPPTWNGDAGQARIRQQKWGSGQRRPIRSSRIKSYKQLLGLKTDLTGRIWYPVCPNAINYGVTGSNWLLSISEPHFPSSVGIPQLEIFHDLLCSCEGYMSWSSYLPRKRTGSGRLLDTLALRSCWQPLP